MQYKYNTLFCSQRLFSSPKICGGVPINPAYLYILGGYMIAAIGAIAYQIVAGDMTSS